MNRDIIVCHITYLSMRSNCNEAMAIPSECKMPDLSGIDSPLLGPLIVQLLVGERGLSPKARLYRRNFIRLSDKAVREYDEARGAILAQVTEAKRSAEEMIKYGRQLHIIAFTDHIETCINAVSRLFKLLERIKSERESPSFPRELRKLVETCSESVKTIRNTVEHMDELIRKDEIAPGKPIMLAVCQEGDGLLVSDCEMKFNDLAMVLEKMHEIALYILTIKKWEPHKI